MTHRGAAACFVVACLLSARALAEPPGDVDRARAHYVAGVKHYDLAEYEQALGKFKDAFRAKSDPAFLFNIAQCHRRLGQNNEALTFYKTYLRRAPGAENRAEVVRRIDELEGIVAGARSGALEPKPAPGPPSFGRSGRTTPSAPDPERAPAANLATSRREEQGTAPGERPIYLRGWFWLGAAALVGAGITAAFFAVPSREICPECRSTTTIRTP